MTTRPSQLDFDGKKIPFGEKYPVDTEESARESLTEVNKTGTPEEKRAVRVAVAAKYPNIPVPELAARRAKGSKHIEEAITAKIIARIEATPTASLRNNANKWKQYLITELRKGVSE